MGADSLMYPFSDLILLEFMDSHKVPIERAEKAKRAEMNPKRAERHLI